MDGLMGDCLPKRSGSTRLVVVKRDGSIPGEMRLVTTRPTTERMSVALA